MRPYSARRSATCWIQGIPALSRSTFRSPSTMGYLKRFRASSRSGRCYSIDRGRYASESGVRVSPVTILQLTTFGLWEHMDSIPHRTGHSLVTIPTLPWNPLVLEGRAAKKVMLYPIRFQQYAVVEIFILVSSITSKTLWSTFQIACAILNPRPSRMFRVLMAMPGGCEGWRGSGGEAVSKRPAPWGVDQ